MLFRRAPRRHRRSTSAREQLVWRASASSRKKSSSATRNETIRDFCFRSMSGSGVQRLSERDCRRNRVRSSTCGLTTGPLSRSGRERTRGRQGDVATCNGVRTCDEEWTWPCAKPLDIARKRREWLGFCATEGMGLDGFESRPRHHTRSRVWVVIAAACVTHRLPPCEPGDTSGHVGTVRNVAGLYVVDVVRFPEWYSRLGKCCQG